MKVARLWPTTRTRRESWPIYQYLHATNWSKGKWDIKKKHTYKGCKTETKKKKKKKNTTQKSQNGVNDRQAADVQ